MHVRFSQAFTYTPSEDRRISIAYKAGWEGLVRAECGSQAIALGRAEMIQTPSRGEAPAPKPVRRRGRRKVAE